MLSLITGKKAKRIYERIKPYEAPFLEERVLGKDVLESPELYPTAFDEFKKFASISVTSREQVAMISDQVDNVWHEFVLFTRQYANFCNNHLGKFLHHSPNTTSTPAAEGSVERFLTLYTKNFGAPHEIWGAEKYSNTSSQVQFKDSGSQCGAIIAGGETGADVASDAGAVSCGSGDAGAGCGGGGCGGGCGS